MIDFRYHLVSLISVFLALAVGIALGAGPLKETIGDSLTGQVEQLRAEKEGLRSDLDQASASLAGEDAFIDQTAAQLLTGRLTGRHVAVVELAPVTDEVADAIDARLTQAGATVTARVTLTPTWTDADQRSYRQALAARLVTYITPAPTTDATIEQELAAALVQALVGSDGTDPTVLGESSSVLLDLMTTGDNPLLTVVGEVNAPADAIVVVGPDGEVQEIPAATVSAWLAVADEAQSRSQGAVLVGGPRGEGSLIDALMVDKDLAGSISSVSGVDLVASQVRVPMALAAQLGGEVGHYGAAEDEQVLPPTISVPDPAPTADTDAQG